MAQQRTSFHSITSSMLQQPKMEYCRASSYKRLLTLRIVTWKQKIQRLGNPLGCHTRTTRSPKPRFRRPLFFWLSTQAWWHQVHLSRLQRQYSESSNPSQNGTCARLDSFQGRGKRRTRRTTCLSCRLFYHLDTCSITNFGRCAIRSATYAARWNLFRRNFIDSRAYQI